MNPQPSNAGFIGLQTKEGQIVVILGFIIITIIIVAGGIYFRAAQMRDRETRQRLREQTEREQS